MMSHAAMTGPFRKSTTLEIVSFTASNAPFTMSRKVSDFLYSTTRPTVRATIAPTIAMIAMPTGFRASRLMAIFAPTTLAASTPTAPAMARNIPGCFDAQSPNACSTGRIFSIAGSSAAPTASFVSSNAIVRPFIRPSAVLAAALASPPNLSLSLPIITSTPAPESARFFIDGSSFLSAPVCPEYAFANAEDTVDSGFPVAAAISSARPKPSWAVVRLPVAIARFASAGRRSSSATAVARLVVEMKSSLAAICPSVAFVVLSRVRASFSCAASSAIAPFAASNAATPRATSAMPAGTALFRTA